MKRLSFRWLKKAGDVFVKSDGGFYVFISLLVLWLRVVWCTSRLRCSGEAYPQGLLREGKTFIIVYWHNRLFFCAAVARHMLRGVCRNWFKKNSRRKGCPWYRDSYTLSSVHRDGKISSSFAMRQGARLIAGSTGKGGSQALRRCVRLLRNHEGIIYITPDGPRGPRYKVSPGVVQMARLSRAAIIPMCWEITRKRIVRRAWDHLLLPKLFGRIEVSWGPPLYFGEAEDAESFRQRLEATMIRQMRALENRLEIPLGARADVAEER